MSVGFTGTHAIRATLPNLSKTPAARGSKLAGVKRRQFIHSAALAASGLTLALHRVGNGIAASLVSAGATPLGDFVRITPDGQVLFQLIKHEMGQGVATALAQVLCEELCADWDKVKIEFPLADMQKYENDRYGGFGTGGSCTLFYSYDMLRKVGATARQMLVNAAAKQWNVAAESCYAENHWVIHRRSLRKLPFGELAPAAATLPVPTEVTLKDESAFSVIGRSKEAKLTAEIVTGQIKYGIDTNVPGMRYAVIERCPVFKGKLKSFDASAALKIAGVRKVFSTQPIAGPQLHTPDMPHDIREGVAVVADSFWAALKGRRALKIEWDEGVNGRFSTEDFERLAAERARQRTDPNGFIGDANAVSNLSRVRKVLRASYRYPHQLHSCMEPLNCTAYVREDRCEIWAGSQSPASFVRALQPLLGLPEEKIIVHLLPSGGGFGRRAYADMAVEAAFISREAGFVPVKMLWTREDDQQCNLAHLFQHLDYEAALDKDNRLYAWYEKEICTYTWGATHANPELPQMAYDIPNIRRDFEEMVREELVHSSAWRGVVSHGRAFSECFIDEIAAELKADPYEFRMSLLTPGREVYIGGENVLSTDRLRQVLQVAAEKAGWGKKMEHGRGMGIALCPYGISCCAAVAEVTVRDRVLTLDRITIAADCGKVINPAGTVHQLTGGMIWSLTALLYGGLPIKNGRAVHTNFHENKLLRMSECPEINVHLVSGSEKRPGGVGEVSTPLGVPAVLNAIYAATGQRLRKIPLPSPLPI
jgi:isoquinoline 1-oxidoreductase subunit beta